MWRPMSTAPKPERGPTDPPEWAMFDHGDFIVPIFGYWDGKAWRDDLGRLMRREPLGWMPVPERLNKEAME